MTDMQWGLGVGCTIAIVLMIISWACFIKAVYDYCTYMSPSPLAPPKPPILSPPSSTLRPSTPPLSSAPPPLSAVRPSAPPAEFLGKLI